MKNLIVSIAVLGMVLSGFAFAKPQDGHPSWVKEGKNMRPERKGKSPWMKGGCPPHPAMIRKYKKGCCGMRERMEGKFKKMRKENPKEYKRLMRLRKDNPAAFRKEIHKRYEKQFKKENPEAFKRMQEMKKIKKNINKFNKQYKRCKDADKKKEIKKQMRELIGRAFDITQEFREEKIKDLEKKTKELRKKVRQRGKNKKEMVNLRLKGLIDGEETVQW